MGTDNRILLNPKTFVCSPWSEDAQKKTGGLEITADMMRYVLKDPKANGPRVAMMVAAADARKAGPEARNTEFMEMLKAEQAKIDKGETKPLTMAEINGEDEEGPPARDKTDGEGGGSASVIPPELKTYLNGLDRKGLFEYAEKTLGMKLAPNLKTERVIEFIEAKIIDQQAAAVAGQTSEG